MIETITNRQENDLLTEILRAELRIRPYTYTTPLLASKSLITRRTNVFLKLENEQHTGSFKARGSMSKVLSLSKKEREQGLVAASTGNHGLGVARAAAETGAKCTIFVPDNAAPSKVKAIKQYGAEIQYTKAGLSEAISHNQARQYAKKRGMAWIAPYNDLQVIAGQGTIGIELVGQLSDIDAVFVTVGGGGLISGIATYLRAVSPKTKIIGCLPENSAEMYHSVQAGRFATEESKETLSDGSAGGFEK